eukprot:gene8898-9849_t
MEEIDKAAVLRERFEKRQEARIKELQKKKVDLAAKVDESENYQAFNKHFSQETAEISRILASLEESSLNKSEVAETFDEIKKRIQNLQQFVTKSVIFLSSFDLRQAQENVQKLDCEVNEKRDKLIPRKKFAFKQRAKKSDAAKQTEIQTDVKIQDSSDMNSTSKDNVENAFGFHDCQDRDFILNADDSKQKDIKVSNLKNCQVKIFGCPSALHVDNLDNCKILCGPISRAAFVSNCNNCQFSLACQQLRIHTTQHTKFHIHVTGKAIIEDCTGLGFAPYNWSYENLNKYFLDSGLNLQLNKWNEIGDFNWLKFDEPSPNWYILSENERDFINEN